MRISEASGGGHPAAWRASDGGLWFATLNGAAVVYPHTGPRNPVPPLPAIEQVLIDDQAVAQTGEGAAIRVAPGHGRVSIKYAGLSFVAPQRVRYRYKLEGFDKGWVEAGSRRTAFYTNVPPGPYRFLVRCVNSDGVWSVAAAEQRFVVEPFFYQTRWFYAVVALALAGLGYLGYTWRVHAVEAQYRAVIEERSRIAREIHDTLAQGYVAISVQLELAERLIASSAAAAVEQLKQTRELVREGLAEARSSIWNLRSQADAEALPSLLAAHVAAAGSRQDAGAAVVKFSVHGAYRPLARSVEKEVMRIAQQAVANAVAHARARTITVTLNYDTQWLALRVVDDGVGMGADETGHALRGHFGLQGMRERAARIGALLEIDTAPGAGVMVALRVELERAAGKDGS
jgi:signal transduction histidine kinase